MLVVSVEVVIVDFWGCCECVWAGLDSASKCCCCFFFFSNDMSCYLVIDWVIWGKIVHGNSKLGCEVGFGYKLHFVEGFVVKECVLGMDGVISEVGNSVSHCFVPEHEFFGVGWFFVGFAGRGIGEEGFKGWCGFCFDWGGGWWDRISSSKGK